MNQKMLFDNSKIFKVPLKSSSQLVAGNTLAFVSIFLFAAGFPAAEVLLDVWHPITLMFVRLLLAVSTLVVFWAFIEGLSSVLKAPWLKGIKIGLLGFGLGTNLLLFAQWFTDPITVALLATLIPISATILEVWDGRRKLNSKFILGLFASIIGGFIAVSENISCLLYTSPSPRDPKTSRMPSSA